MPGTTSLFMDAARRPQDRTAGCRWISYDSRFGETIQGTSMELFVTSPLMAEALAVREALLQARDLHLSNICLKSDNHVLIKALISKQHPVELHGTESIWISRNYLHPSRLLLFLMFLEA